MRRMKNRKGVFVVLFGLLFMVLMGAAAMSIDMSRIWTMRNELQTAADAGAIAGAVQLNPPHPRAAAEDTARAMAQLNRAMYDLVTVDSVQLGTWDDATSTFTLVSGATVPNAVHVVVSHGTNKMIMGAFGIAAPRVKARATAWANAPVNNSNCIRPWSSPLRDPDAESQHRRGKGEHQGESNAAIYRRGPQCTRGGRTKRRERSSSSWERVTEIKRGSLIPTRQ